jgi:hypothetical protein
VTPEELFSLELQWLGKGDALWKPGPYYDRHGNVVTIELADVGYIW